MNSSWIQPDGIWIKRKASWDLCSLGLGLDISVENNKLIKDIDTQGNHGWIYWAHSPKPYDLIKLEKLVSIEWRNKPNFQGETALYILALRGLIDSVDGWFKKWPEDFNLPIFSNLLLGAAWSGQPKILKFLIEKFELDLDFQDEDGLTALMVSVHRQPKSNWNLFLESGANLNIQDKKGKNVLHHIAEYGDFEGFHLLESAGGDVEQKDKDNKTPEHIFERAQQKPAGLDKALLKRWQQAYYKKIIF